MFWILVMILKDQFLFSLQIFDNIYVGEGLTEKLAYSDAVASGLSAFANGCMNIASIDENLNKLSISKSEDTSTSTTEFLPNIVEDKKALPTDTSDFCSMSSNESITKQYFIDIFDKLATEKYSMSLDDQTEADGEVTIFTMGLSVSFFLTQITNLIILKKIL